MSNFEPYEVSKAKSDVIELLNDEFQFGTSDEYSNALSSKIVDMLLSNGMIITEDYR